MIVMNHADWEDEGKRRFGENVRQWRFVCPSCSYVASVQDWLDAKAPEGAVGFSCVGRYRSAKAQEAFTGPPGPCNYAGGGLFQINPVYVEGTRVFAFAEATNEAPASA